MHAISDETTHLVDVVLDYARRRALSEDIPLDKPIVRATSRGSRRLDHARRHRRAPRDRAVRERARARLHLDRPPAATCRSSRPPPPRPRSRSTSSCRHRRSTAARGWRAPAPCTPRTRCCTGSPREFGLPAGAGGVFVQGGTIGNLSALVAARDAARRRNRAAGAADPARWIIVCSAEAHSSIASAAAVMDVDVVTARAGRRRAPARRRRARGARRARRAVFAVVATGGTTNFGIVDDIASIAAVDQDARRLAAHRRRLRARRDARRADAPDRSRASSTPTRSSSTRTSGCSRRSTRAR